MAPRTPSTVFRASSAFTALLTAWCLGCSAFEPLLGALNATPLAQEMTCQSAAQDGQAPVGIVEVAPGADQGGLACGCEYCAAVSLPVFSLSFVTSPLPLVTVSDAPELVGIEPTPLVPPPLTTV
jgi:hypothetical protein